IAILTATFMAYLDEEQALQKIPVLQMLSRSQEELKAQAEEVAETLKEAKGIQVRVAPSFSVMGGGSLPTEEMKSYGLVLSLQGEAVNLLQRG
ncbi:Pyridoxal phosphate-dependent transferase, partial [gut metagenome]